MDQPNAAPRPNRLRVGFWILFLLCAGFAAAVIVAIRQDAGMSAVWQQQSCVINMHNLAVALFFYDQRAGHLPPAYTVDDQGNRLHSWRTLLLRELERPDVFRNCDLNQPWNSPKNLQAAITIDRFRCSADKSKKTAPLTNYVVVTGPGTAFPEGGKTTRLADFKDGPAKTILLVETADTDIGWMEPRDLTLAEALQGIDPKQGRGISSHHPGGVNVVFADGHTQLIPADISPAELKAMLTIDAGD